MITRRKLLQLSTAMTIASLSFKQTECEETKPLRPGQTYVYKKVGDCQIKADVYGAAGKGSKKPVIIHIHGGALITGRRFPIREGRLNPLLKAGFVVVSIDYRLAPETKLPGIIQDIQDAFQWVREKGPELFGADPDRIGVQGGSAGGYLTLMTGFCVQPRPKALVSYYGYGDIIGEWYSKPDPFYCKKPRVSREKADAAVSDHIISEPPKGKPRHFFYLYCRQNGLWPKEVAGFDPHTEPEKFKPYCPVQNVTPGYPPTFLCHGTKDTDVPYDQSVQMAAALARNGVPHEVIPLQGADHGFPKTDPKILKNVHQRAAVFFVHYLKR